MNQNIKKLFFKKSPNSIFTRIQQFPDVDPAIRSEVLNNFTAEFDIAPDCPLNREDIQKLSKKYFWHYAFKVNPDILIESDVSFTRGLHGRHFQRYSNLFPAIVEMAGMSRESLKVLDCACNCGFWSIQAVRNGFKKIVGFDGSEGNIEQANFLKQIIGLPQVEYRVLDIHSMSADQLGTYDVTFFLGILYHLNKPLDVLAQLREVTRGFAVIDTDIIAAKGPILRLVSDQVHDQNVSNRIAMYPSPTAVEQMLKHVGFKKVWYLNNEGDVPEIYRKNQRAAFIAE